MFGTLSLHGFRGFESYRMADLAPVNLIVGKNNCGKTSILEAVQLIASQGHPAALSEVVRRRREGASSRRPYYTVDVSHLFFGHECRPGIQFELSSDNGAQVLSVRVLSLDEAGDHVDRWRVSKRQRDIDLDEDIDPAFGLRITSGPEREVVLPLGVDGTVLYESPRSFHAESEAKVRFLGLNSDMDRGMSEAWDNTLAQGGEQEIAADMRLLVPEIDSIHFLSGARTSGNILIGRQGGGRRMPLGSFGDGLRRLLALRLALVGATDGFLLIDEIDAGLHWTVMEDVWRLLVEVAKRSNVQIFATTHSYDSIRGLGLLIRSRPDLAGDVSIQKIHELLQQSVAIRGEQIEIAVEQEIEVR